MQGTDLLPGNFNLQVDKNGQKTGRFCLPKKWSRVLSDGNYFSMKRRLALEKYMDQEERHRKKGWDVRIGSWLIWMLQCAFETV